MGWSPKDDKIICLKIQKGANMADILEYLDWRGDIPFEVDPFNDVDNLILAQISYTDFEGVATQDEELSIEEMARIYFEIHTEEEINSRDTFYKLAPMVLKKAAESRRFQGTIICHYINMISTSREEQYSAVTYRLPNGISYVAFRGTDNTIVGWKEDFNLTFMSETTGQRRAVEYVDFYFGNTDEKLMLGGHSKGGNFAVYAGAFCSPEVQDRIINVFSNDGPGFRDEILKREGYQKILPRVVSILPEESIVGVLLSSEYENHIVKSSAKNINQHDPMTWQVYGNQFVEAEKISDGSRLIDKTFRKWLATMNDEERAVFTDTLFSTIDVAGVTTLSDVSEGGLKLFTEVMKSIKHLAPERQHEVSLGLKNLFRIGGGLLASDVKNKAKLSLPSRPLTDKESLRKEIISQRNKLSEEEIANNSKAICQTIYTLDEYKEADIILAYMSFGSEASLKELITKSKKAGKKVYIPKITNKSPNKREMKFYLHDGRFTKGAFGIQEPKNTSDMKMYDAELEYMLDKNRKTLVIMPAVAFDIYRDRLGYGGGYYDRFLASVKDYPITFIAVGFDCQIVDRVPAEEYDQRPAKIITEKRIIE